jgi:hypothetical protein
MEPIPIICKSKEEKGLFDFSSLFLLFFRQNFLNKFSVGGEFCQSNQKIDCDKKTEFRLPNGLCNNLERPLDGNSHTAFGRLKPADYSDCM